MGRGPQKGKKEEEEAGDLCKRASVAGESRRVRSHGVDAGLLRRRRQYDM